MNYIVQFINPELIDYSGFGAPDRRPAKAEVTVSEVHYTSIDDGFYVKLMGSDPYNYPEWLQDSTETHRWFSKNLTLMLHTESRVRIEKVTPTSAEVPQSDPNY